MPSAFFFRVGTFFFLFLITFNSVGQRVYATQLPFSDPPEFYEFGCDTSEDCPISLFRPPIADGDLSTFSEAVFNGMGMAYFGVIFSEFTEEYEFNPLKNKRIGIKLGFKNNDFNSEKLNYLIQNIKLYAVDGYANKILDDAGNFIQVIFDNSNITSGLELGDTTFEIVTQNIPSDFYGISLEIDNNGILTGTDIKVFEFYVIDSSCNHYLDHIYTNSPDNQGFVLKNQSEITLNPGIEVIDVSFLFDSFSYANDSISMIFEKYSGFSLENITEYFTIFPYSDNTPLSQTPLLIESNNSVLNDLGGNLFQLTFPVNPSFNRVKLVLNEVLELKELFRKSGGEPLTIDPDGYFKKEGDMFIYRESIEPIFLKPELLDASVFEWFFDYTLLDPIINGGTKDGVSYSISSDGTLKIENLSSANDPFIIFLSAKDPVSGCTIVKKIDFEMEGIILPLIQISLKGQMLSNQIALLNWTINKGDELESAFLTLEKAKEDLFFAPISEQMEWINQKEYTFTDKFPFSGNNFYRISVNTKKSDEILYSDVINVRNDQRNYENDFFVYPNPFWDYLNIELNKSLREPVFFNIFDLAGRNILTLNASEVERVGNRFRLDLSFLKNGIYIFNVQNANFVKSFKVIKK